MAKHLLVLLSVLTLSSCAASTNTKVSTNPLGYMTQIRLHTDAVYTGELLAVQDSVLLLRTDSLVIIRQADIKIVDLIFYQNRSGWILATVFLELTPSAFLIARGASSPYGKSSEIAAGILGLTVTGATAALFINSEEQSTYTWPPNFKELQQLQLHSRYPYGLSAAQIDTLRSSIRLGK